MGKDNSMTRADMVAIVSSKTGIEKTSVERVIDCFLDAIVEELSRGRSVRLSGFGNFENNLYKPRKLKSAFTGQTVALKQRVIPKYKPAKKVRDYVDKKVSSSLAKGTDDIA